MIEIRLPVRDPGPVSVNRYLLPNERQVIMMRRHPALLLIPGAEGVAGLAVALIVNGTLIHSFTVRVAVWTGAAFLIYQALSQCAGWWVRYTVVTQLRVLIIHGLARRTIEEIPLDRLKDIMFDRSFAGRLLGYGTFYLPSGTRRQALLDYVPYPEQVYLELNGMLFESGKGDEGTKRNDD